MDAEDEIDSVVKLRGLPWSCKESDIVEFLGGKNGIIEPTNGFFLSLLLFD